VVQVRIFLAFCNVLTSLFLCRQVVSQAREQLVMTVVVVYAMITLVQVSAFFATISVGTLEFEEVQAY